MSNNSPKIMVFCSPELLPFLERSVPIQTLNKASKLDVSWIFLLEVQGNKCKDITILVIAFHVNKVSSQSY